MIDLVGDDPSLSTLPSDLLGLYSMVVSAGWPNAPDEVKREQQDRMAAAAWHMVSDRMPNEDKRRLDGLETSLLESLADAPERNARPVRLVRRRAAAFEFVHDQMHAYMAARWFAQDGFEVEQLERMIAESKIWSDTKSAREVLWTFASALLDDDRLLSLWVRVDDNDDWNVLRLALKKEAERRGLQFPY